MEEVTTVEQALEEMSKPGVSDLHRWNMLALAMRWMAVQKGCDLRKDMLHPSRGGTETDLLPPDVFLRQRHPPELLCFFTE